MTKAILSTITVLCFSIGVPSCCHKKGCIDAGQIDYIQFNDFKATDIDNLVFTRFIKNQGFSTKADSFFVYPGEVGTSETVLVNLNFKMDLDSDWQLRIPATNATHRISDFMVTKSICNRCFAGNDYYNRMETYRLNGELHEGNLISIVK